MSGRITTMFNRLEGGRAALITYATGLFPGRKESARLIKAMLDSGSDAVEIGLPFSDPVIDGPVIQESSRLALENGATPGGVLELVSEIRKETEKPVMIMSYYNPILKYGLSCFARDAAGAGADGIIIPDLPVEEMGPWKEESDREGLETVCFCSVTTTDERISLVSSMTTGFMYCISLLGTTGIRDTVNPELFPFIERVRRNSECPVAVGIGISNPRQCTEVGKVSDGVIVGSALVKTVIDGKGVDGVGRLVRSLAESLRENGETHNS
ncbi:MAG: tryptophan synthase subunit alpha [Actinobacteria bacterium]|nr:tryptophan synthase subunit alpha [Actinomycetota bacterium]